LKDHAKAPGRGSERTYSIVVPAPLPDKDERVLGKLTADQRARFLDTWFSLNYNSILEEAEPMTDVQVLWDLEEDPDGNV
jgi:hypothetical protein